VMELVDGRALDVRLPTDMSTLCDVFVQVAAGLDAMHRLGYVHCDMKPNNVIRDEAGKVKIIDYGQSCPHRHHQGPHPGHARLHRTRAGAPPAGDAADRCVQSRRDDVLAFTGGKHIPTLYKTNRQGDNSFLLDETFEPPQAFNPTLSPALSNLIMECIATNPRKRPANMEQMIHRIEIGKHIMLKTAGVAKV